MAKKIDAAEAVKALAKQDIKVQVARKVTLKGKDGGRDRDAFETEMKPLAAAHVLAAVQADNGAVTITTSDGKKYSTAA